MRDEKAAPTLVLLTVGAVLLAACAAKRERAAVPAEAARPKVVTVPQLQNMAELGTTPAVIYSEIEGSGTVYRLTTLQSRNLRASGMPAGVLSFMELTYQHAVQTNPDLARSDAQWTEIDGYWYGGLPFGWPREWVVGAPRPREMLR